MQEPNFDCDYCGNASYNSPSKIIRNHKNFCSKECSYKYKSKKVEVICLVCQKIFCKQLCEAKRYTRHCCSQECSKLLAKLRKDWGSTRSKLEIFIEGEMTKIFSFLIDYNKTDIGYELDIYIPHLDLAIELNGIFHYKPIYGMEKLLRVQQIDREKVIECKKRNIKLIVIDVSKDKSTKKVMKERYEQVLSFIKERIEEFDNNQNLIQLLS